MNKNKIMSYLDKFSHESLSVQRIIEDSGDQGVTPWNYQTASREQIRLKFKTERITQDDSKQYQTNRMRKPLSKRQLSNTRRLEPVCDIVKAKPYDFMPIEDSVSLPKKHSMNSCIHKQPSSNRFRVKTLSQARKFENCSSQRHEDFRKFKGMPSSTCNMFYFKGRSPGVQDRIKNIKLLRQPSYRQQLGGRLTTLH